jgi:5'-deoxynucleotidase YfbR-like HD superfamily hydrolase
MDQKINGTDGLVVNNPNVIMTASGILFDFVNPRPEQVKLSDISFSLAGIYRWGAHHHSRISVATHSVNVAKKLEDAGCPYWVCLQGLMHDASEAYVGDMCRPIKRKFPEFSQMENKIMEVVFHATEVVWPLEDIVHEADSSAMHDEWATFEAHATEDRDRQAARFEAEYWRLRALATEAARDMALEAHFRSIG